VKGVSTDRYGILPPQIDTRIKPGQKQFEYALYSEIFEVVSAEFQIKRRKQLEL